MIWDPERYVLGNYIQNEINEEFLKTIHIELSGNILDIGCGDGHYTSLLASKVKQGQILGIDSSEHMIMHANQQWARKGLSFEVHNIEEFHRPQTFDLVLSFWCLHWTNIHMSFPNIFQLLKKEGKLYVVMSSFSDHSILQTWKELAKQNLYKDLTEQYISPINEKYFYGVINLLNRLPFKQVKLDLKTCHIYLPHIDYYKNLLLTMPFIKRVPSEITDTLVEDMSKAFQTICEKKYGGQLYYETRPIFLKAVK
ncbi:TPA: trans-aconitate 2-methyltransferase [Legionella pneumophila]|uniref:Class I SAM-dependent methyltransferase n=1 Tax=Legionella pneumophila TaxID=446 RepID=A0AAN5R4Z9_LEGPN|nr:class I SAM-dependent methyltransferase [Legionella pneumophila]HAT1972556.1 class I SAM-dependent methyltransferase [Legionella pneumophila]HEN4769944.1 class I SAM-dependent methyltransferase [Legionella pneumophila]